MDVWVVAAAAGAGYVAQRLKNLNRSKYNLSDLSSKNLNFVRPDSPGAVQKLQEGFGQELCRQREQAYHDASSAEMASTSRSEGDNQAMSDNFASWGTVSNSTSLAGLLNNENVQDRVSSDCYEVSASDSMPQPSLREIGFSYGFRRDKSSLRGRGIKSKFIKPRNSVESCLMAQLYKEHVKTEEYIYSVRPPQKQILRPFLVTDGSRIISRTPHESCSKPSGMVKPELWTDTHQQENKSVVGIPRLPNVVPAESQKKYKARPGEEQVLMRSRNTKLDNGNQNNAQGLSVGALLFHLGLTVGIISSFLGNKQEIDKLKKSLMQTENLVQDLQEELEMKDALTVKELVVEDYEVLDVQNDSHVDDAVQGLSLEEKLDDSSKYCRQECCDQNSEEESLRKIEAELEAELDVLESNMNSSRLEAKLSSLAKLDPSLVSDVIEGELRPDLFGAETGIQAYANRDGSSCSTPCSARYPVSPRELSLRLHEVIQSRLEERVKELEMALQQSQKKIKRIESDHMRSLRELNYKIGSSSKHESPIVRDGVESSDQPIVINLSGEALAAYNEVYDEFTKLSESDEEKSNCREILHPCNLNLDLVQNGGLRGNMGRHLLSNGSQEMSHDPLQEVHNTLPDDALCSSREESEDEMEKLLIRQIVEKARLGSPAVLEAQRALLSTDEN